MTARSADLSLWTVYIGHFAGVLPLWLNTWPIIITILRNPVARTVSHIKHVKRDPTHPLHHSAKDVTVTEYCFDPVLSRSVENFQSRYLASLAFAQALTRAENRLEKGPGQISVAFEDSLHSLQRGPLLQKYAEKALEDIDAVGTAEAHQASLQLFSKVLGLHRPTNQYHANVGPSDEEIGLRLRSEDYAAIEAVTEIDKAVYEHADKIFRLSCERYGIKVD